MIENVTGNIFSARVEALVNPVNCVGIMGRGLALKFKQIFTENFKTYAKACSNGEVTPGRMFIYKTGVPNPNYIVNFPTKRHWRDNSLIEDVSAGLIDMVRVIQLHNIKSIAIPPLGCGLGGLSWTDVKPLIETALSGLHNIKIIIYNPI